MEIPEIGAEFEGAALGDERRSRRLMQIARRLGREPSQSLPEAAQSDAELEGCYRFLNNEQVAPEAILAPHQRCTVERAAEHGEVLVVHDTTKFRYSDDDSREGLGPLLAKGGARGFYAHVSLAVTLGAVRDPLGVLAMHSYVRADERVYSKQAKGLCAPNNEYSRFPLLVQRSEKLLSGRATAIHVIDREADIYELFAQMREQNHRFVIRLSDDRATTTKREDSRGHLKLSDVVGTLTGVAEREVPLSVRKGKRLPSERKIHPAREGRIAKLSFRATPVELRRPDSAEKLLPASLALHLVHVIEVDPPQGQEPVEWMLLTTEPIQTAEDVLRNVDIYRARWTIEEFFKALKTGCAFEQRQFRSYDALCRLLAVMLPVAWRLLRIRALARVDPERPGSDLLTPTQRPSINPGDPAWPGPRRTKFRLPPTPTPAKGESLAAVGLRGEARRARRWVRAAGRMKHVSSRVSR